MVAKDALEEGRRDKAKELLEQGRRLNPKTPVPLVLHELVPFDEDEVTREMAAELDVEPDDLVVSEDTHFDTDSFTVSTGRPDWRVVHSEEEATEMAKASVIQDLENEPEIFNRNWLLNHIDDEKLKMLVYDMGMEDDYVDEMAPSEFWQFARRMRLTIPDDVEAALDDGEDAREPDTSEIQEVKEAYANEQAQDPWSRLTDMMGADEAVQYVMQNVGIDVNAAADTAISTDGWEHFLARYDGKSYVTPAGFVYWREN